jgi:hypothetical protein
LRKEFYETAAAAAAAAMTSEGLALNLHIGTTLKP